MIEKRTRRRWHQFTIRMLLFVMLIAGLSARWYAIHRSRVILRPRARWERLSILFNRHADRAAAASAIADMGSRVFFGGETFGNVARTMSEGPDAKRGGFNDWTQKGAFESRAIEEAVLNSPPHQLSTIIEDESGLHIVRVLERESAATNAQ